MGTSPLCCLFWGKEGWPHPQGSGSLCQMSPDCSLMCYQRRCVSSGYVGCQTGLDQATTRSRLCSQTVRDRHLTAQACQLRCWATPHISAGLTKRILPNDRTLTTLKNKKTKNRSLFHKRLNLRYARFMFKLHLTMQYIIFSWPCWKVSDGYKRVWRTLI